MPNQYDVEFVTQEQVLTVMSSTSWKTIEDIMKELNLEGRRKYKAVSYRLMVLTHKGKVKGYYKTLGKTRRQKYVLCDHGTINKI